MDIKNIDIKSKNMQAELHQTQKYPHLKRNDKKKAGGNLQSWRKYL
jgi:hypothetical protein